MENYTTQMDAARRGIVTEQIRIVAGERAYAGRETDAARGRGQGGDLRQQAPHLPGSGGRGQHAPHKDQRQSRRIARLQGL